MEEEKSEETIENPVEEETTEEKPQQEGADNPEETAKTSQEEQKRKDRLYARMKKAEEEAKRLKAQLKEVETVKKETPVNTPVSDLSVDPYNLAKTVATLKDYSPEEIDYISLIAKAKGVAPEEAVNSEEVKLYISARREKVAKEQSIPNPSSPSSSNLKPSAQDIAKMSREEHKKLVEEYKKKMTGRTGI